jgi:hypothetical protein
VATTVVTLRAAFVVEEVIGAPEPVGMALALVAIR